MLQQSIQGDGRNDPRRRRSLLGSLFVRERRFTHDENAIAVSVQSPFEFGENWRRYLEHVDENRILQAERSLVSMLDRETLAGCSFVDVGCGSGLFSLAALRLGASPVHSIDVDLESVMCARELKRRYANGAEDWTLGAESIIDDAGVASLGQWDIVYSWGVLHHTGEMWHAFDNIERLVAPGGRLFISIYNDQGRRSHIWRAVKHGYNSLPRSVRKPYVVAVLLPRELLSAGFSILRLRPGGYIRSWSAYSGNRGMSRWHDMVDWVGGYPYEVARPDEIFDRFRRSGFQLERLVTSRGWGCNEFVFRRCEP